MFSFETVLCAYRKAKYTSFRDTNCANGIKFAIFEENLQDNLRHIHRITNSNTTWFDDPKNLGIWRQIPKSGLPASESASVIRTNPFDDWRAQWTKSRNKKEPVAFRHIFDATAEFQIISALWCITAGAKFDETLDKKHIYGSRIRRTGKHVNMTCAPLFGLYQHAYGAWQRNGLRRIKNALKDDDTIVAVTMDIKKFYHNINVGFATNKNFLKTSPKILCTTDEHKLTQKIVRATNAVNKAGGYQLGLPVGLTYSTVLANTLLRQLDQSIIEETSPVYYGRYVDDVFLVVNPGREFQSDKEFTLWLAGRCNKVLKVDESGALKVTINGAIKSNIEFGVDKQHIFNLHGSHGLDLVEPIERRLREQASAIRSLPLIPEDEGRITSDVLRLSTSTAHEVNGLRKADHLSLRRAEFATLLTKADAYSRNLSATQWSKVRETIFAIANNHLLHPAGFFDLSRYIPRVFRIASRSKDIKAIKQLSATAKQMYDCLRDTVGKDKKLIRPLNECWTNIGRSVLEAVLTTQDSNTAAEKAAEYLKVAWANLPIIDWTNHWGQLTTADWMDESYGRAWIRGALPATSNTKPPFQPPKSWRWTSVSNFASRFNVAAPDWRPTLFPTRTIPASIISAVASRSAGDEHENVSARHLTALRTTWYDSRLKPKSKLRKNNPITSVPTRLSSQKTIRIVVANAKIEQEQWRKAALGVPDLTKERYESVNAFFNRLMDDHVRWSSHNTKIATYVVAPELYLPQKWWPPIVQKLGRLGINAVIGLEYRTTNSGPINEVIIGLENKYLPQDLYVYTQSKRAPAWEEENELRKLLGGVGLVRSPDPRAIFDHGNFSFSTLICNELTDIEARAALRGNVDALFIPEWNKDVGSFATLVESSSLDVHAFIVQSNNRAYGDSRIRAPARQEWQRDVVRVKGGVEDHYVSADLHVQKLRKFQTSAEPQLGEDADFKPFPTGFVIAQRRRSH